MRVTVIIREKDDKTIGRVYLQWPIYIFYINRYEMYTYYNMIGYLPIILLYYEKSYQYES